MSGTDSRRIPCKNGLSHEHALGVGERIGRAGRNQDARKATVPRRCNEEPRTRRVAAARRTDRRIAGVLGRKAPQGASVCKHTDRNRRGLYAPARLEGGGHHLRDRLGSSRFPHSAGNRSDWAREQERTCKDAANLRPTFRPVVDSRPVRPHAPCFARGDSGRSTRPYRLNGGRSPGNGYGRPRLGTRETDSTTYCTKDCTEQGSPRLPTLHDVARQAGRSGQSRTIGKH
jgi:hypothetical protein